MIPNSGMKRALFKMYPFYFSFLLIVKKKTNFKKYFLTIVPSVADAIDKCLYQVLDYAMLYFISMLVPVCLFVTWGHISHTLLL